MLYKTTPKDGRHVYTLPTVSAQRISSISFKQNKNKEPNRKMTWDVNRHLPEARMAR